mmetsp:Transcript_115542/g.331643  ORF Transcript_115542/g.331643 Transcript_115542/m.331643 type:complete len:571 (+) Transcript_115542:52-1764(+)
MRGDRTLAPPRLPPVATSGASEAPSSPCWSGMGVHVQGACLPWAGSGYSTSAATEWPQMGMEQRAEVVVVVDPYGSGRFIVDELLARGWPLVAVRTSPEAPEHLSSTWDPSLFERSIVHGGDVLGTARSLREGLKRPVAVVAGSERGAELADALAEVLSLRGNGTALSRCRQDKYFMQERLRECGLRASAQRRCRSVQEAMMSAAEFGRPVVVKPCASSGTDCVSKCKSVEAVGDAAAGILGGRNVHGQRNDAVIIQEFLRGSEYIVDCVSLDGQHVVTSIWALQKTGSSSEFAYDRKHPVPFSSEEGSVQRIVCEYAYQALTALGVQTGASHSKVIYDENLGPCLVKMCPWIHGSVAPAVFAACAGRENAQAFLLADALTEGGLYLSWKAEAVGMGSPAYELSSFSVILDLQCHEDGILARSVEEVAGEWIRNLSSFWMMKCDLEPGDRLQRSRDFFTSPGYIVLSGPDPSIVEQEAAMIREAERTGQMYIFSTSTSSKTPTPPACSDDEGTWGKCGLFLRVPCDPSPRMRALEAQVAGLLGSPTGGPNASPELLPKACAEFVLDGVLE